MPTTYKVLGQQAPAAATDATLYTVPAATQTIISTLVVTNRGASPTTFRLRVAVGGAAVANQQYLAYDVVIPALTLLTLTMGVTLAATDQIVCQCGAAQVSFQAFGQENS